MMAQIKADLSPSRQTLRPFYEMNFVLVPDTQPRLPINFFNYPDESDLDGGTGATGLYPIAVNLPIENWPVGTGTLTLAEWQRDVNNTGGDRHAIIVAPGVGSIWETWLTRLVGSNWEASNGAKFDLNSNTLRPAGWTSGDAAGLAMFPALVRYDECERGLVEHALRLVVAKTRREYIYPATHYASSIPATSTQYPAMGQRLRLKASFVIPSSWTIEERAVLLALKKYGAIVADNGGFFSVSVCPDDRFAFNAFAHLSTIDINNFLWNIGAGIGLVGALNASNGGVITQWAQYSGPGTVTFDSAFALQTMAHFSAPGVYTLMLNGRDGVHAVAYDAVVVHVMPQLAISRSGSDIAVRFATAIGQNYVVEEAADALAPAWVRFADNLAGTGGELSITDSGAANQPHRFYRVVQLP
ncbi:MAG: hypothetical protein ACR2F0_08895 [Chthoniobacterales bacterium]